MLDLSSRKVYGALAEQCVGGDAKADKVESAVAGHLAGLDSNGNLTDSGVSPTEEVTVEGNPVTFDSPFEQDAKSVVVSVKPIQDLHGYDHPWVGGAGKNKLYCELQLPYDTGKGIVATSDGNGGVYLNGTSTEGIIIGNVFKTDVLTGQSTFCKLTSAEPDGLVYIGHWPNGDYYSPIAGFETAGTDGYWEMGLYFPNSGIVCNNVHLTPMVIMGDAHDADYAPYSNICPISGIDEVEIGVSGRNIWNERIELGSINSNGENVPSSNELRSTDYIRVKPNTDYYFYEGFSPAYHDVYFYDENKSFISRDPSDVTAFTTPLNAHFIRFRLNSGYGTTYRNDICINVSDASFNGHYEPYNPNSHTTTIPLPSTLYDADVDVTEGAGNVTKVIKSITSATLDQIGTTKCRVVVNYDSGLESNYIGAGTYGISNVLDLSYVDTVGFSENSRVYTFIPHEIGILIVLPFTTQSEVDAWIEQNEPTICYELATPTTLSLTPTNVELLEGTNVVSTNAEKVAVTYGRSLWQDIDKLKTDTEGKLNKSDVADVEGDTASKAYSVNDFMLRADGLYKVTQPIAQNASITSSNTTKTTIGAVLTALLNA